MQDSILNKAREVGCLDYRQETHFPVATWEDAKTLCDYIKAQGCDGVICNTGGKYHVRFTEILTND